MSEHDWDHIPRKAGQILEIPTEMSFHRMRFPYVTVCGPMRGFKYMLEVAEELTSEGWIVLMPFVNKADPGKGKLSQTLDQMHNQKIDLSRAIVVVTVDGYVGWSTRNEVMYAASLNKEIFWRNFDAADDAADQESSASVDRSEVRYEIPTQTDYTATYRRPVVDVELPMSEGSNR